MVRIESELEKILSTGPMTALIDVDGVALDNTHRLPHILNEDFSQRSDPDWPAFLSLWHMDTPTIFTPLLRVIVDAGVVPVFLTARVEHKDDMKALYAEQLDAALDAKLKICTHHLILRDGDSTANAVATRGEYKTLAAKKIQELGANIIVAIDDSRVHCADFVAAGIPTLKACNYVLTEHW